MKKYFIYIIDTFRNIFRQKQKRVIHHAADRDYEYNAQRAENRAEIDRILDKISRYGKKSLTRSEQEFLKNTHEF